MRRDMKLITEILRHTENSESADAEKQPELVPLPQLKGYTPEQVRYHALLCEDAGFIGLERRADFDTSPETMRITGITGLKWAGHERLQAIRETEAVEQFQNMDKASS